MPEASRPVLEIADAERIDPDPLRASVPVPRFHLDHTAPHIGEHGRHDFQRRGFDALTGGGGHADEEPFVPPAFPMDMRIRHDHHPSGAVSDDIEADAFLRIESRSTHRGSCISGASRSDVPVSAGWLTYDQAVAGFPT